MSEKHNELTAPQPPVLDVLDLAGAERMISLEGLSETQTAELKSALANKMIDLRGKKAELTMDLQGLNYKLETMTANAQKANDAGVSVTINHTQTDATGKTEVVIGNSQRAHRGMTLPGGWLLPFCAGLALAVLASRLI